MTDEPQPIIARIWPIIEVPYCDATGTSKENEKGAENV